MSPRLAVLLAPLALLTACGEPPGPDVDAGPGIEDSGGPVVVCERAADCEDGLFCNGVERCAPGDADADADGCVRGAPGSACPASDVCDDMMNRCRRMDCTTESQRNMDGDGAVHPDCATGDEPVDCDDNDARRSPENFEVCDAEGLDEDCDPSTIAGDDGDLDNDGVISDQCCGVPAGGGDLICGTDCDDGAISINPGAAESCNMVDDDCDGSVDEGQLTTYYRDVDGDLYGDPDDTMESCAPISGYTDRAGDCDDDAPMVNPISAERCDGIDNDCDETVDETGPEIGTREHCSACGDECQFACSSGVCDSVVSLGASSVFTCASLSGDRTFCWGSNDQRQLAGAVGAESTVPLESPTLSGRDVRSLALAGNTACALVDGQPWCWGRDGLEGALGRGTAGGAPDDPAPVLRAGFAFQASMVSGTSNHFCAVRSNGSALCWGRDTEGQLGNGPTPGNGSAQDVAGSLTFSAVVAGSRTTCGIALDGDLHCWGENTYGQFGNGTRTSTDAPTPTPVLSSVTAVTVGRDHVCALRSDGGVTCAGRNEYGQLGDGIVDHADNACGAAANADCSLTWVTVAGVSNAEALFASESRTCARETGGAVLCWGRNASPGSSLAPNYLFGVSAPDRSSDAVAAPLLDSAFLALSPRTSCALLPSEAVTCWGLNDVGQIGDATNEDRPLPVSVAPPAP